MVGPPAPGTAPGNTARAKQRWPRVQGFVAGHRLRRHILLRPIDAKSEPLPPDPDADDPITVILTNAATGPTHVSFWNAMRKSFR